MPFQRTGTAAFQHARPAGQPDRSPVIRWRKPDRRPPSPLSLASSGASAHPLSRPVSWTPGVGVVEVRPPPDDEDDDDGSSLPFASPRPRPLSANSARSVASRSPAPRDEPSVKLFSNPRPPSLGSRPRSLRSTSSRHRPPTPPPGSPIAPDSRLGHALMSPTPSHPSRGGSSAHSVPARSPARSTGSRSHHGSSSPSASRPTRSNAGAHLGEGSRAGSNRSVSAPVVASVGAFPSEGEGRVEVESMPSPSPRRSGSGSGGRFEGASSSTARRTSEQKQVLSPPQRQKIDWEDLKLPYFQDFAVLLIAIIRYARKVKTWRETRKLKKLQARRDGGPNVGGVSVDSSKPSSPPPPRAWPKEPEVAHVWRKDGHAGWKAVKLRVTPFGWEPVPFPDDGSSRPTSRSGSRMSQGGPAA